MLHELKILPKYFKDVKKGVKTFELRKNDRNFKVGDVLVLEEYDSSIQWEDVNGKKVNYSGEKVLRTVTYVLSNIDGLDKEYVILGIKPISQDIELKWSNKLSMKEWGKISCPMLDNKEVMTYYSKDMYPFDTFTNPFIDKEGTIYSYHFDQDEGNWIEDVKSVIVYGNEYTRLDTVVTLKY